MNQRLDVKNGEIDCLALLFYSVRIGERRGCMTARTALPQEYFQVRYTGLTSTFSYRIVMKFKVFSLNNIEINWYFYYNFYEQLCYDASTTFYLTWVYKSFPNDYLIWSLMAKSVFDRSFIDRFDWVRLITLLWFDIQK